MGEPPLMLAISVLGAIRDAVDALLDGDVDVILANLNEPVRVLKNVSPHRTVAVVELKDEALGRHVPGARVRLEIGDRTWTRWPSGGSYQSVDAPVAYFATGDLPPDAAATLRIDWPGGEESTYTKVPLDRRIRVVRGADRVEAATLPGRSAKADEPGP